MLLFHRVGLWLSGQRLLTLFSSLASCLPSGLHTEYTVSDICVGVIQAYSRPFPSLSTLPFTLFDGWKSITKEPLISHVEDGAFHQPGSPWPRRAKLFYKHAPAYSAINRTFMCNKLFLLSHWHQGLPVTAASAILLHVSWPLYLKW